MAAANEKLLQVAARFWQSPRVSLCFVVGFAAWLAIGTWYSFPGERDPWTVFEGKISLMSRVGTDMTARGSVLLDSYSELKKHAYLIGDGQLEFRRTASAEPTFALLSMAIDLPPGEKLVVRDAASGEELVITECPGLLTHLGLPVTGTGARFELTPSGNQIAYRFPRHVAVRLLPPADQPFRITAITEFSLPIDVRGGKLKLGSGWEFDAGEDKQHVPTAPLAMRRQAWLEVIPGQSGTCRIRIPIRKLRDSDPDPVFHVSGSEVPAVITSGVAELTLRINNKAWLRLGRPGGPSGHVLDAVYVVGVTEITIKP